ncbi:MAG: hypothetical protein KAV87_24240 [Desulfobacteraceae bacterium]|nr:hypothetical protein [Desulfobacteraceae bacterium]
MAFRENMSVGNLKILKSLDLRGPIIGPQAFGGFGDHYFLSSVIGTDGVGKGGTKSSPFATLDYALSQMTADNDDTLHIMPNHAETITGAGGITLDVAGANIQGYGRYDARPTFLMDGAACSMLVTAADVSIENCVFNSGHLALAYLALISAKGFRFAYNYVGENVATEDWVTVLQTLTTSDNAADGLEVVGNEIVGINATATGCVVLNKNANDVKILGNMITGQFGVTPFAPIYAPSTEVMVNIDIGYNKIHNLHNADAAVGISVANTTSTGWMHNNYVYALDTNANTPFVAGATGLGCFNNKTVISGTMSGYDMPTLGTYAA